MTGKTLSARGEGWLLAALARRLGGSARSGVPSKLGDDAVALRARGALWVCSADMLVENVDFRRRWATPDDIGSKAAAANLSDIAAMGARPAGLLASVAARADVAANDVLRLLLAIDRRGRADGAPLLGGDLSSTAGPLVVSVTALANGEPPLWCRRGARLGDVVCVTGPLGAARAGLAVLEDAAVRRRAPARAAHACARRQKSGTAHLFVARALHGRCAVHSVADVSDGLLADAAHLVPSHLRVAIDTARVPIDAATRAVARAARVDAAAWALCGGEDFVLAMALPKGAVDDARRRVKAAGGQLWPVGRIERRPRGGGAVRLWPDDAARAAWARTAFGHFVRGRR